MSRKHAHKQNKTVELDIIVTGRTTTKMDDEGNLTKQTEDEILRNLRAKQCYLCHRKQGETGIWFRDDTVYLHEVMVDWCKVYVGRTLHRFPLCVDCAVLMTLQGLEFK